MSVNAMLLLPVVGMFALTATILVWMIRLRYRAVLKDGLNPYYFKLYKGAKLPDYLLKVTQHYHNLFKMPLFFYMAIILIVVLNKAGVAYAVLSWLYFATRLAHSYVHTGSNRLVHRKNTFIASNVVLLIIWLGLSIDIVLL